MLEEVKADLAAFKGETKAEFAGVRGEISGIKMVVEHHLFFEAQHLTLKPFDKWCLLGTQ